MRFRLAGIVFGLSVICFLILTGFQKVEPGKKHQELNAACHSLDSALVAFDTVKLNGLLHEQISIGHSNGLIENKQLLLEHLRSGYLNYETINQEGKTEISFLENMARVRRTLSVKGNIDGQPFNIKLKVLEVWTSGKGNWQLWSRQSVKIN